MNDLRATEIKAQSVRLIDATIKDESMFTACKRIWPRVDFAKTLIDERIADGWVERYHRVGRLIIIVAYTLGVTGPYTIDVVQFERRLSKAFKRANVRRSDESW